MNVQAKKYTQYSDVCEWMDTLAFFTQD